MGIEVKALQTKRNTKRTVFFGLIGMYEELVSIFFHVALVLFCSSD